MLNTNSPHPNPLDAIMERLNETVSKVSKLGLLFRDLELELNEIRQQCENEIQARNAASMTDKAPILAMETSGEQLTRALKPRQGKTNFRRTGIPTLARKQDYNPMKSESKGCFPLPTPIPGSPGLSEGPKSPEGSLRKGGNQILRPHYAPSQSRSLATQTQMQGGRLVSARRRLERSPNSEQIILIPRPPIHPSPFPRNIDRSSYVSELKREGPDWFVLFNPSPKVKRVLDVNVVHTLVHDSRVLCVRFSQDGKCFATGCWGTAQIYDVRTGVKACVLDHGNDIGINHVCFSPNGKYLATAAIGGAGDMRIRVWNVTEKQIYNIFEGRQSVFSICFSSDGRSIVFGSADRSVCIWDIHDGTLKLLIIDGHYLPHGQYHGISPVAISPDGRYVAGGNADSVVGIWEFTTGVLVQKLHGHRETVTCAGFTPDGKGLISGSYDRTLKYWDVSGLAIESGVGTVLTSSLTTTSSPCLMNFTGHEDDVLSMAVSHDGNWIVSGSRDRNVLLWDARTGVVQCMLSGHETGVYQVDLSPMGNVLATVGWDRRVRIWCYGVSNSQ